MTTQTATRKIASLNDVTLADIMTAYKGRPGCMCGCKGTYTTTTANRATAEADFGYKFEPKRINDKRVQELLEVIQSLAKSGATVDHGGTYAHLELGGRVFALYFVPGVVF